MPKYITHAALWCQYCQKMVGFGRSHVRAGRIFTKCSVCGQRIPVKNADGDNRARAINVLGEEYFA